jgi:hypothetical protein
MTTIVGAGGLTVGEVRRGIGEGARFVVYQFCISVVVMSFRNSSAVHFVRDGERNWGPALAMSTVSLVAGWWGIPWGPIWTVGTIVQNLAGGKDVTENVLLALSAWPDDARIPANGSTAQLGTVFE